MPEMDVLDNLMGVVPQRELCTMCYFPIRSDRPLHDGTKICVNCFGQINDGDFSLGDGCATENEFRMNCCVLCTEEITEDRMRHNNSNVCAICVDMLNDENYELVLNDTETEENTESSQTTPVISSDPPTPTSDSEDFIDKLHQRLDRNCSNDVTDELHQSADRKDYKDALLASLYSQVEFLRKQVENETKINQNLVEYIMSMRAVTKPHVSFSSKVQRKSPSPSVSSSASSSGENSESEDESNSETTRLFKGYIRTPTQQHHHHHQQQQQQQQQNKEQNSPNLDPDRVLERKDTRDQLQDYKNQRSAAYQQERANDPLMDTQFASWEKHSSKYASRMMSKWGYAGGGLGKNGNGITSPIKARPLRRSSPADTSWGKDTTLIIGDSMLNGIKEDRLKRYNAKVEACPGATIKDMYDVITPLLVKKPAKVILHVGTNDAPYKPSTVIVNELVQLRKFILSNLPGGKVILSAPIMRTDNKLANSTIRDITNAMKSLPNIILNEKIDAFCLGRKGLHLNDKGSGKLAMNFISEMQRV